VINSVIGFVVALVPLIALHEIGHMLMAKWLGVWVREFGIGLPPRMIKLFQWQETEFTLNWLPLGGFARMEGEEALLAEDEPGEAGRRAADSHSNGRVPKAQPLR